MVITLYLHSPSFAPHLQSLLEQPLVSAPDFHKTHGDPQTLDFEIPMFVVEEQLGWGYQYWISA